MRTRKASALVLLAIQRQSESNQKALQDILNAALADDPTLNGGTLNAGSGEWIFPGDAAETEETATAAK